MRLKNIVFFFCVIEILLIMPRTISYILIDIIPIRVLSLPLITFSYLVTIAGYMATEIIANREVLRRLLKFRLIIFIWSGIVVLSIIINPLRDVVFETQGMIIFMMSIVMFSVISFELGIKRNRLIWGVFLSITSIISVVISILIVNPSILPAGYSVSGLRYEGLFSSTPLMALVSISTAFLFFYKNVKRIIGVFGILVAFTGLIFAATRSAMGACLISSSIVIYYVLRSQKMGVLFRRMLIVLPLVVFTIVQIIQIFPAVSSHVEYTLSRVNKLSAGSYDTSRTAEMLFELDLFRKSPLFGHGYGIMNQYRLPDWGSPIFGHNFITSILSRTGILGFGLIAWYGSYIYRQLSYPKSPESFILYTIAKASFMGAVFLILISNFTGYQTFGVYGILIGIACGAKISDDKAISINSSLHMKKAE